MELGEEAGVDEGLRGGIDSGFTLRREVRGGCEVG